MSDVHQLVEHAGAKNSASPPWTVSARCGYREIRQSKDPLPARFSAWGSDVTCDGCLGRTPPQQVALLD